MSSGSNKSAGLWMAASFSATLAATLIVLAFVGSDEKGAIAALRLSARISFLLFWIAYAGGATAKLFGPAFAFLGRRGREFGLAFASAQLVHVGAIAWLFHVSADPPRFTDGIILAESIGILWIYAIAALSTERLSLALGARGRRLFFSAGLNYVAILFFINFVVLPIRAGSLHASQILSYLPFALLSIAGPLLWWAAFLQSSRRGGRAASI
ncbi:hypothetical protein [Methylocapsa acidiphila]|uniref:hypothetical protein n=1 Tax=Methylocapsa acidiphila TaxID=133552 RepID=UPI00041121B6|nr:hypothetical protein [Methylocapsa acidiphila]